MPEIIRFEGVWKKYGYTQTALRNFSLSIQKGEFITFIGPSGCGKTTALKLINRLIHPTKGKIYVDQKEVRNWDPIVLRRKIGYVIQQIGLFPHMTIEDNIGYVLEIMNVSKGKRKQRAEELIELVGLPQETLLKYPRELSGGQQQRIGVARALAADPEIILMDEPFGAIDEITRKVMQDELLQIQQRLGKTIVFVTHDIEEAMKLGSRIGLMKDGELVQIGTKQEMFFQPKNEFVKSFFGIKNFTSYLNLEEVGKAVDAKVPVLTALKGEIKNDDQSYETYMPVVDENGTFIGAYMNNEEINPNLWLKEDCSIMEAIRKLFKEGIEQLSVVDESFRYKGVFRLNGAYARMEKR